MGLELPELYSLSTLNYIFGVSFCSYAIKIFTFPDKATDIFIPAVLNEIIQHVWRRCTLWATVKMASEQSELQWGAMWEEGVWNAFSHPPENGIRSDRRWRISNYSTRSPDMQREQPIKTWRRGLASSYTKTQREIKKEKGVARARERETKRQEWDVKIFSLLVHQPRFRRCVPYESGKKASILAGFEPPKEAWTTRLICSFMPEHIPIKAHKGCDMRNQM